MTQKSKIPPQFNSKVLIQNALPTLYNKCQRHALISWYIQPLFSHTVSLLFPSAHAALNFKLPRFLWSSFSLCFLNFLIEFSTRHHFLLGWKFPRYFLILFSNSLRSIKLTLDSLSSWHTCRCHRKSARSWVIFNSLYSIILENLCKSSILNRFEVASY